MRWLIQILRLLLDTFFLLFELFKFINELDFSFVKFHCVRLLCLLYCHLWLNQKLSNLSSNGHSLDFTLSIHNYHLRDPLLSIVIEKQLSNRVRHRSFMKQFSSSMLTCLNISTCKTHHHNKLTIDIEITSN